MISEMKKYIIPIGINVKRTPLLKSFDIDIFKFRKIEEKELKNFYGITKIRRDTNGRAKTVSGPEISGRGFLLSISLSGTETMRLWNTQYVIEFIANEAADFEKQITRLLLSFKLLKSQSFFAPIILCEDTTKVDFVKFQSTYKINTNFVLTKKELHEARDLYYKIAELESEPKIGLILERYNYTIGGNITEKNLFVELVSILESLYLDNDTNQLSFRFSLIISYILNNPTKTKFNFDWSKKIYDTRSELIHSGKSKKYNDELYNSLKENTGKLIIWYLKNNKNYKEIERKIFNILNID